MITSSDSQLAPALLSLATLGITWIFTPALQAAFSRELECEERVLGEGKRDMGQPLLSIVVPAYDEEARINNMLQDAHNFLHSPSGKAILQQLEACSKLIDPTHAEGVEWIVIDDGSKDNTRGVVESSSQRLQSKDSWHLVTLKANSGKGAAVKTGMLKARGLFRLMVDADGATDFGPGLQRLVCQLEATLTRKSVGRSDLIAVFGSRAHLQENHTNQRSLMRLFLMHAFHFFVGLFVCTRIKDTQCGFKLFTKSSAVLAFNALHLHRWAFDIEVKISAMTSAPTIRFHFSNSILLACSDFRDRRNWNPGGRCAMAWNRWLEAQYIQAVVGLCQPLHAQRHDLCARLLFCWNMESHWKLTPFCLQSDG